MLSTFLRAPARRAVFTASIPKAPVRRQAAFRRFSTAPPSEPAKSNTALYAALGAATVAGLGYWFYASDAGREAVTAAKSGVQSGKVALNFTPAKEDYQKVGERLGIWVRRCLTCRDGGIGVQQNCRIC